MDYLKRMTLPASNLLNCVKHDTDDRHIWVFLVDTDNNDDKDGRMQWVITDEKPQKAGYKIVGIQKKSYVEIKVKEVFTDAGEMLKAERENGFHSHKGVEQDDAFYAFLS